MLKGLGGLGDMAKIMSMLIRQLRTRNMQRIHFRNRHGPMQITPYSQIRHEELLLRSVIRQHVKPINEGIGEDKDWDVGHTL